MLLIIKRKKQDLKKMLPDQHQRCSDSKMKAFFSSPFSVALAWTTTFTSSQVSANVKPLGSWPDLKPSASVPGQSYFPPRSWSPWSARIGLLKAPDEKRGVGGEPIGWNYRLQQMPTSGHQEQFSTVWQSKIYLQLAKHNGVLRLLNYFLFGSCMATVIQKLPGFSWCWFPPHSFTWNWFAASTSVPPRCVIKLQRPPIPPGNLDARRFMLSVLLFDSSQSQNLRNLNKT